MTKILWTVAVMLLQAVMMLATPASAQDSGYVLRPGDVIQVEVLEDPSLNRSTLILPNGSITFPQAGTLAAAGRTPDQLRTALTNALAGGFASPPTVYVSVASIAQPKVADTVVNGVPMLGPTMNVYVLGEVSAPGLKKVEPATNLLQFLSQAGALSKFAAERRIELHRRNLQTGREDVYLFNLKRTGGMEGRISGLTQLGDGDVIVVPQRGLFE